eukprot:tig00000042_g15663.t1
MRAAVHSARPTPRRLLYVNAGLDLYPLVHLDGSGAYDEYIFTDARGRPSGPSKFGGVCGTDATALAGRLRERLALVHGAEEVTLSADGVLAGRGPGWCMRYYLGVADWELAERLDADLLDGVTGLWIGASVPAPTAVGAARNLAFVHATPLCEEMMREAGLGGDVAVESIDEMEFDAESGTYRPSVPTEPWTQEDAPEDGE